MFQDYIVRGGIGWMLPILILSVISLALSMERCFFWAGFYLKNRRYKKDLKKVSKAPFNLDQAIEITSRSSNKLSKILNLFLRGIKQTNIENAEQLVSTEIEHVLQETRTGLDVLSFIANVSGTLGLLGTVVGVSMAMESMGLGDPAQLTSALSIALYTTIAGVVLFVFSYFFVFLFTKFSNNLEYQLIRQVNTLKNVAQQIYP